MPAGGQQQSATRTTEYIQFIARTYRDDLNGYRRDILGRKDPGPSIEAIGQSLVRNKRTSVASGHGVGKSSLSADAIHWFISTRPHPAIVATANTEDQLTKKLWRELNLTNQNAKNRDWFDWKASSFTMFNDPTAQAVALAWSEGNSEAFAGTHAEHVLGVFDEASAIPKIIFTVFNGAMTTPGARWLAVGNSTRNEGYFYEITHGKFVARKPGDIERGMWKSFVVPSWESPFVTEEWLREWELNEGCDRTGDPRTWSDDFRIRVAGLPPRSSTTTFFNPELVQAAMARKLDMFDRWPLILGCDVGRGDRSVMLPRRGRIVLPRVEIINGIRTTDFARRIAAEIKFYREEHGLEAQVILEELGMGVGVVEALEDMGYADQVWGVNTGEAASDPKLHRNLRAQMYDDAREWIEDVVELPNIPALADDMREIRKKPTPNGVLLLESKDDLRRRGVKSTDVSDAFALTFAVPFDLLAERRSRWGNDYHDLQPAGGSWMGN